MSSRKKEYLEMAMSLPIQFVGHIVTQLGQLFEFDEQRTRIKEYILIVSVLTTGEIQF